MLEKREERKEKSEENKKPTIFYRKLSVLFGGDEEDRTLDLTDANRTLSQLSYAPIDAPYLTAFLQKCQGVVCKKLSIQNLLIAGISAVDHVTPRKVKSISCVDTYCFQSGAVC